MKLLIIASSLDLIHPFSATPAWWQLLKGLYEIGVEVVVTPYQGPAIESLWWRAVPNPAKWQGDIYMAVHKLFPQTVQHTDHVSEETAKDKLARLAAQKLVAPLWWDHIDRLLTREPDFDAVIILTVPLNHLVGVATEIQRKHDKPVLYYDGDVPASLPNMHGFATGFRIYQGANPEEYTAFISNSVGGSEMLKMLGAKEAHTLFYGADPDVFSPMTINEQDIDVFFYGHGREYREGWIDAMITEPSKALSDLCFAVRGTQLGDLGCAQTLPYLSFSKLHEYASRSKINLCITRSAHANVYASSSSRPFELAAMGCCIIANPYQGLDMWFEPEHEIITVNSSEEAIERYSYLLMNEKERRMIGNAARQRVLKEHTFTHRAHELVKIVHQYV